jgi:hypothetical protein
MGSIAGAPFRESGKSLTKRLAKSGAAHSTIVEALRRLLNVRTRKALVDGSSARTTSSLCTANCVINSAPMKKTLPRRE